MLTPAQRSAFAVFVAAAVAVAFAWMLVVEVVLFPWIASTLRPDPAIGKFLYMGLSWGGAILLNATVAAAFGLWRRATPRASKAGAAVLVVSLPYFTALPAVLFACAAFAFCT